MPKRSSNFDWYFTWTLAGATFLLLCAGLVVNVLELVVGEDAIDAFFANATIPPALAFLVMPLVIAVFWFWFRMLGDYFKNRPDKHPVGWGWALFLLNIVAAVAYFWFIWRPRNAPRALSVA